MMPLTDTDAHGSKALGSSNAKGSMPSLLRQHYLGLHKMRLGNIMCTEMVRTLSQPGLARVAQSIREVGWLDQFAPSIVIPREAVRDGEQLTAESALKATGRVLDGNHRVTVLKREFAEDDAFLMRIYRDFANPALERVIANCEQARVLSWQPCPIPSVVVYDKRTLLTGCCVECWVMVPRSSSWFCVSVYFGSDIVFFASCTTAVCSRINTTVLTLCPAIAHRNNACSLQRGDREHG